MPSGEEVAGFKLPVFGAETGPTTEKTKARPPTGVEVRDGATPKKEDPPPFTLGELRTATSPFQASGKDSQRRFCRHGMAWHGMAELLRDNIEAERRHSRASNPDTPSGVPGRREVPDLFSWVQCFGVYAAVVSSRNFFPLL